MYVANLKNICVLKTNVHKSQGDRGRQIATSLRKVPCRSSTKCNTLKCWYFGNLFISSQLICLDVFWLMNDGKETSIVATVRIVTEENETTNMSAPFVDRRTSGAWAYFRSHYGVRAPCTNLGLKVHFMIPTIHNTWRVQFRIFST
jgi:hypothetical protein